MNTKVKDRTQIEEKNQTRLELLRPSWYQVVLLNDDFTPMEFVVNILINIFQLEPERAQSLMLQVHRQGRAICGVYPLDIAETKADQVHRSAEEAEYPLRCLLEQA